MKVFYDISLLFIRVDLNFKGLKGFKGLNFKFLGFLSYFKLFKHCFKCDILAKTSFFMCGQVLRGKFPVRHHLLIKMVIL